jgi:hypothetical protein
MMKTRLDQELSPELLMYLMVCSIPGCGNRSYRYRVAKWYYKPLCSRHYNRMCRNGHPVFGAKEHDYQYHSDKSADEHWSMLARWTRKFGYRFQARSLTGLAKQCASRWVCLPYTATGPRTGASKHLYTSRVLDSWVCRGWVTMEEPSPGVRLFVVCQSVFGSKKLPNGADK